MLDVVLTGGYTPAAGDQFEGLDFTWLEGEFTLDLPELGTGLTWGTTRLYSTGPLLIATPEPTPSCWPSWPWPPHRFKCGAGDIWG